jgi:hypothetical protein
MKAKAQVGVGVVGENLPKVLKINNNLIIQIRTLFCI